MATAAAVPSPGRRHESRFFSVFPKANFTTPTPDVTPNIGPLSSPSQSFGGFNIPTNVADQTVQLDRAWSAITRFLALPPGLTRGDNALGHDAHRTLLFLLDSVETRKNLVAWYTNEVSVHFRNFVLPQLGEWQSPISLPQAAEVLQKTTSLLQVAQQYYLGVLSDLVLNIGRAYDTSSILAFANQIKQNLHVLVLHSLPRQRLQKTLASVMFEHMQSSLQQNSNPDKCSRKDACHCKVTAHGFPSEQLHEVGLGGTLGERAFAHAVHRFLQGPAIERRCFEVDWTGQSCVVARLRAWVEQELGSFIERVLIGLTGNNKLKLATNDLQQFTSMSVALLGQLRTRSMFDYIKRWPDCTGAILDIKEHISAGGPRDKAHVCQSFSDQIQHRLLHAGASTSEILGIYINVIHAFKLLDSRGVMLGKVAVPIRSYLRSREDTVSIMAASFLADADQKESAPGVDFDICHDITIAVANSTLEESRDNKLLNWDDMDWTPDPIDAGPDYKSSRSEDIVAYILGLFEPDELIKEVTTALAQHLLHATDSEYVKETRLVELFKSRLDATKLQAAEVMLKDMRDSVSLGKRINPCVAYDSTGPSAPTPREVQAAIPEEGITLASLYSGFESRVNRSQFIATVKLVANRRNDLFYPKRTRLPPEPADPSRQTKDVPTSFKAQILSGFFWPQLRSNDFRLPPAIETLQTSFERRFDTLGSQRKLHFRPALARVSLRLDLEDRTIEESEIPGWRASVIDAFTGPQSEGTAPNIQNDDQTSLSVDQLVDALQMEQELVQDALNFWINKRVLYQRAPGVYAVLERLDMDISATAAAAGQQQPPSPNQHLQQQEETISTLRSQDAMLREGAPMFQTFIANMLRNTGPKEVGGMMGITNVLKMVNPTFTYGDGEVLWLLGEMEGRGEVKRNGELWAVA